MSPILAPLTRSMGSIRSAVVDMAVEADDDEKDDAVDESANIPEAAMFTNGVRLNDIDEFNDFEFTYDNIN